MGVVGVYPEKEPKARCMPGGREGSKPSDVPAQSANRVYEGRRKRALPVSSRVYPRVSIASNIWKREAIKEKRNRTKEKDWKLEVNGKEGRRVARNVLRVRLIRRRGSFE